MKVRAVPAWFGNHPMAGDAIWAAVYTPLTLTGTVVLAEEAHLNGLVGLLVGGAVLTAMLWRRRHPELLAAALTPALLMEVWWSDSPNPLGLVAPVTLYAIAAYSTRRWYRAWLIAALFACGVAGYDWSFNAALTARSDAPRAPLIVHCLVNSAALAAGVMASWVMGELARQRRRNLRALQDRAEALERERDQRGRLAAQEERSRIAREMHDVVAHNLSVIVVQADGAHYAATHGSDPATRAQTAARTLETIAATAREALAETRRLVGVLREDDANAEYAPQAGLAQIPGLVARMHSPRVATSYDEIGHAASHPVLPGGAQKAAYRIVQESLTNVVKHAGEGVHATVTVEHTTDGVTVTVRDDGAGSKGGTRSDGHGNGLIGMRERVTAFGGTLTARDRMAHGYEVIATIPAAGHTARSGVGAGQDGTDAVRRSVG